MDERTHVPVEPAWLISGRLDVCRFEFEDKVFPPLGHLYDDKYQKYWVLDEQRFMDIQAYRKSSGEKPIEISWGDWIGPNWYGRHNSRLSPRNRRACMMYRAGVNKTQIARRTGLTLARVCILLSSSVARRYCDRQDGKFYIPIQWPFAGYVLIRRMAMWGVPLEGFTQSALMMWSPNKKNWYQMMYLAHMRKSFDSGKGKTDPATKQKD